MSRRTELGTALRALRTASGLTGETVARRAAMSAGKLSKIETGKVLPSVTDTDLIRMWSIGTVRPWRCSPLLMCRRSRRRTGW
ncbi:hypothetical protein CTZ27_02775 [Streptomyces griseocarneus]|nr:hypothetical protein CTZ27_02775 [Streptomyces griseocarneus]